MGASNRFTACEREDDVMNLRLGTWIALAAATVIGTVACVAQRESFYLPEGDPVAGKEAAHAMRCFVCHEFAGSDFPAPHAEPAVPVTLGAAQAAQSRERLAESIIAPSHRIAEGLEGATSGELSRMGDYSHAMSVRQMIDIVAYVRTLPEAD
jgi:hypothetical protein